ncbi:hypothetical protein E4U17_005744 [Claviceps sp. LM77 group G4]|nr:hypothetical protein E4U17_005744 [Claviceps sp. LM77 group G4]KAG6077297.1 hypothetical protein E4U16_002316 [Claviceps sp. LM84 group G4]KAG6079091.1 hypothetical protein E4U33_000392 [Claviceps sp. LM78 group G4]
MSYAEASPVFQHPDGQFYPLGMEMPMYDGEGLDDFSESYLASSLYASVDSGRPSHDMDYMSNPQIIDSNIDSNNHADTNSTNSQSGVSFDFLGFPIDVSANLTPTATGEEVDLVRVSRETEHYSYWDHPGLASMARQFLEIQSQRPEPMADPHLSSPGSYIDLSISPDVDFLSTWSMPPPDIGSDGSFYVAPVPMGMPAPGNGSSPLSMPSLSRSSYPEDGVDQSRQPSSSAGQSPQIQRDFIHSPSPVEIQVTQPAMMSTKEYQDQILMADRENGLSYKQIKALRNFDVSESTLRGRVRNLTKSIDQRPRKPVWTERDLYLLKIAVPLCTFTTRRRRVSWKAVSQFIHKHGKSPHAFAYATCHNKWKELTKRGIVSP